MVLNILRDNPLRGAMKYSANRTKAMRPPVFRYRSRCPWFMIEPPL